MYRIQNRVLRNLIRRVVLRLEGGQMRSATIRRIYSHYHQIDIGMYSYGGCFDLANVGSGVKIGKYCSFAPRIDILNVSHPVTCKSSHPFFYHPNCSHYVKEDVRPRTPLEIGSDVWMGQNAILLSGVGRLGDGAIVGAGAVVTKDVPDFAIVAGNPAKVLSYRFDKDTIHKLKEECWWDKNIEELEGCFEEFQISNFTTKSLRTIVRSRHLERN